MKGFFVNFIRRPAFDMSLRALWAVTALVVIVGSLLPGDSAVLRTVDKIVPNDKAQHFAAYAGLSFLPTLHERAGRLRVLLMMVIILGVLLEFGQLLSPGRTCDIYDALADCAGVLGGFLVALPLRWKRSA